MAESPTLEAPVAESIRPPSSGGTFAAFSIRYYPRVWSSGYLWNLTRWMSIFLCSYLVNELTHSPFLVQLVGAAFFAPMFFGGMLGGLISDRFDRRRTILLQLGALVPIALAMGIVALVGELRAWMLYPFVLAVGIGGVVDMTSRRALVYDLVGESRLTNALALEMLALTGGGMTGNLLAGSIVSGLGSGAAFLVVAACYLVSFALLFGVSAPAHARSTASASVLRELAAGFAFVRREPTLLSILGVTVVMNLFFFSFMPLVPVFAERLEVSALWAGVLASANAGGSMIGTILLARGLHIGRGAIYVGGSVVSLTFLLVFAASPFYPLSFVALMLSGVGVAGFGTMQGVLVMVSAGDAMRGRAMGLLSMAIGALPFSMLLLGGVAQVAGVATAVVGSSIVGLIVLAAFSAYRPEAKNVGL